MTTFKQPYSPTPVPLPATPTLTARGVSGRQYQMQLHPLGTQYLDRSGVYIFVKRAANGAWDAVYIGETGSFKRRLTDELRLHHQWQGIVAHGATHIGTLHVQGGVAPREGIETDLRGAIVTPCNRQ
jgi:hypothetical protein